MSSTTNKIECFVKDGASWRRADAEAARLSVIVPVLNDARQLERLLPQLRSGLDCHEVIVVDGGSVDDSVSTARQGLPGIRVIREVRCNRGAAVTAGFAAVTGDVVVVVDADADPTDWADLEDQVRGSLLRRPTGHTDRVGPLAALARVLTGSTNRRLTAAPLAA